MARPEILENLIVTWIGKCSCFLGIQIFVTLFSRGHNGTAFRVRYISPHQHVLFSQPTLMRNFLYSLTICFHNIILDMFRALTCPSSGEKIVFTQHLVSSLSVNVCTVHWNRSQPVYCADVYRERRYQMLCEYNFSS